MTIKALITIILVSTLLSAFLMTTYVCDKLAWHFGFYTQRDY